MKFVPNMLKESVLLELNRPKLLIRFLISYILILLIPVAFFVFFTFNNAVKGLTEEVEDATITKLTQTMDMIDMRLEGLNHLAAQLPQNQNIKPFLYARNIYNLTEYEFYLMMKALSYYRATNVFIDNIYIFFRDVDIFISADGKYDMYTFFNQVLKYDEVTRSEIIKTLNSIQRVTYRSAEHIHVGTSEMEIITYLQPIPISETSPKATLLICMEAGSINRLLYNALGNYLGNCYILDQNGNIISCISNMNDNVVPNDIYSLTENSQWHYVQYKKISGTNMMVCCVKSEKTGWSYMALLPSRQILSKVINIKILSMAVIFLATIIGIAMSFCFSYIHYHPIKEIVEKLTKYSKYSNSEIKCKYNNELDMINNVLTAIILKDNSMEHLINKHIPYVRANFLMRLLNGDFMSKQEIDEIAEFVKISIPVGPFAVILFNIGDYENFAKLNSVMAQHAYRISIGNVAEEMCEKTGNKGHIVDVSGDRVAMIIDFKMQNKRHVEQMVDIGKNMTEIFSRHYNIELTVGIGRVYDDIMGISKSYVEAQTAIEYKIVKGKNTVIVFDDIITNSCDNYYYTLYHENMIINGLKLGDFENIRQILSSIIENITGNPISINMAKCIYFEIINTAMKALGELSPREYNKIMSNGEILPNFFKCETLIDVYNETVEFYKVICDRIKNIRDDIENEVKNNIFEYMHNNYSDYEMSLLLLAHKFQQTPSSISRMFKNETGYNFTDYLHNLRLNKAKELLKNTDKNISDIALECGYLSSHSFIRCFKRYNLITPGRFRELCMMKNE